MLQLSRSLIGRSVMSLRTGGVVAKTEQALFNPNNLKIEGFLCADKFSKDTLVLLSQDIRDNIPQGFVINDHDVLANPEELVRLKDILEINYQLIDKPVVTVTKKKIGKINDYAVDSEALYVQKIYVTQSLLKSFSGGQISVDRNQIVEVTTRRIIIKDPLQGTKATSPVAAQAT